MKITDPVQYALSTEKTLLVILSTSFLGICLLLAFVSPYSGGLGISLFYLLAFCILFSVQSFMFFWWEFSIKKKILTIIQINNTLYQSAIGSSLLLYLFSFFHTGQFGMIILLLITFIYFIYLLFLKI